MKCFLQKLITFGLVILSSRLPYYVLSSPNPVPLPLVANMIDVPETPSGVSNDFEKESSFVIPFSPQQDAPIHESSLYLNPALISTEEIEAKQIPVDSTINSDNETFYNSPMLLTLLEDSTPRDTETSITDSVTDSELETNTFTSTTHLNDAETQIPLLGRSILANSFQKYTDNEPSVSDSSSTTRIEPVQEPQDAVSDTANSFHSNSFQVFTGIDPNLEEDTKISKNVLRNSGQVPKTGALESDDSEQDGLNARRNGPSRDPDDPNSTGDDSSDNSGGNSVPPAADEDDTVDSETSSSDEESGSSNSHVPDAANDEDSGSVEYDMAVVEGDKADTNEPSKPNDEDSGSVEYDMAVVEGDKEDTNEPSKPNDVDSEDGIKEDESLDESTDDGNGNESTDDKSNDGKVDTTGQDELSDETNGEDDTNTLDESNDDGSNAKDSNDEDASGAGDTDYSAGSEYEPTASHPGKEGKLDETGELPESVRNLFPSIEISHTLAVQLCQEVLPITDPYRSYLWIRINQYVPLYSRGFPLSPPTFTPACLKWRLQKCRGMVRSPLLERCTYWAPMKLQVPQCIDPPEEATETYWVNYRPVEYTPSNCPCKWPCEAKYDAIQKCEIKKITAHEPKVLVIDKISNSGIPEDSLEVTNHEVLQLCKGIQRNFGRFMEPKKSVSIHYIPFRIESASGKKVEDDPNKCSSWNYDPCSEKSPESSSDSDEEPKYIAPSEEKHQAGKLMKLQTNKPSSKQKSRQKRFIRRRRKNLQSQKKVFSGGGIKIMEIGANADKENLNPDTNAIQNDIGESCGIWLKQSKETCYTKETQVVREKVSVSTIPKCPGGWPCFLSGPSSPREKFHFSKTKQCPCDWPCLPFFVAINTCYDAGGKVLVDAHGRKLVLPTVPTRPKTERGFVSCLSYMDKVTILCSIKQPENIMNDFPDASANSDSSEAKPDYS